MEKMTHRISVLKSQSRRVDWIGILQGKTRYEILQIRRWNFGYQKIRDCFTGLSLSNFKRIHWQKNYKAHRYKVNCLVS